MNRDGVLDLAFTHPRLDTVSTCLGNGDGTFAPCLDLGRVGDNPRGLAAADFNRDGALDLAVSATGDGAVVVLDGTGDRRFAQPRRIGAAAHPFLLVATDLNRDSIPDMAVAQEDSGVVVFLGDGQGGFERAVYRTGKWSSDVAASDFNGDGTVDLAVTNWGTNNVSILAGKGDGTFGAARNITYEGEPWEHHSLYRVLTADLDRDGHADLVWNDIISQSLYLLYGNGKGDFPRHASVPAGRGVRHADAADFDRDGWLDLVSANTADDEVTVLLSDGRGAFVRPQHVPVGHYPRMAVACDVNNDTRPDVVVTNLKSDHVTVLINTGITDAAAVEPAPRRKALGSALNQPGAVVVDRTGQLLIADEANHRVVRIDPASGALSAVAGTGYKGSSGDDGPAVDAQLNRPGGLAMDAAGNLYVADSGNDRVRKIDAHGLITTAAGTGTAGDTGDGGPAPQAQLRRPLGLAVDRGNALFIADSGNHRIRRVDPNGTITTVVGTGAEGYSGDGGRGTHTAIRGPSGLATEVTGALLFTDRVNHRVRKLGRDGTVTTVAGNGTLGARGDGGPATEAQLAYPSSVSVGADGVVFIADALNQAIRRVALDGTISAMAVSPAVRDPSNAGSGAAVSWEPAGITTDASGNVFFTDRRHNCVRRIDASGRVSLVAGTELAPAPAHQVRVEPDALGLLPLSAAGSPVALAWEYTFRSGSDDNAVYGVAPGPAGVVYAAGDIGSGADWRIQQLDASGQPGWHFDFDGGDVDVPLALARTPDGTVVAAGVSSGSEENDRDLAVIALAPDGQPRWRYAEARPGEQTCRAIQADAANNVYIAGESGQQWDVFSLDSRGALRWRYEDATPGNANAISVDQSAHALVAGSEPQAWRVIKLNPDHTLAWQHRVAGRATAYGIQALPDGGAVVVGAREDKRLNLRAERLNAAGNVVWEYEATSAIGPVLARAVTVDANEMPIIVGEIGSDWLVLALDAQGKRRWHFTHDGGGGLTNRDQAFAVAFQAPDTIVVAGRVHPLPPKPPSLGQVDWRVAAYRAARQ